MIIWTLRTIFEGSHHLTLEGPSASIDASKFLLANKSRFLKYYRFVLLTFIFFILVDALVVFLVLKKHYKNISNVFAVSSADKNLSTLFKQQQGRISLFNLNDELDNKTWIEQTIVAESSKTTIKSRQ